MGVRTPTLLVFAAIDNLRLETRDERIARVRRTWARAFEPWSEDEDARLLRRYDEGARVEVPARHREQRRFLFLHVMQDALAQDLDAGSAIEIEESRLTLPIGHVERYVVLEQAHATHADAQEAVACAKATIFPSALRVIIWICLRSCIFIIDGNS